VGRVRLFRSGRGIASGEMPGLIAQSEATAYGRGCWRHGWLDGIQGAGQRPGGFVFPLGPPKGNIERLCKPCFFS